MIAAILASNSDVDASLARIQIRLKPLLSNVESVGQCVGIGPGCALPHSPRERLMLSRLLTLQRARILTEKEVTTLGDHPLLLPRMAEWNATSCKDA
jgi:hypothetical protein